jgi:hypothetical protein
MMPITVWDFFSSFLLSLHSFWHVWNSEGKSFFFLAILLYLGQMKYCKVLAA